MDLHQMVCCLIENVIYSAGLRIIFCCISAGALFSFSLLVLSTWTVRELVGWQPCLPLRPVFSLQFCGLVWLDLISACFGWLFNCVANSLWQRHVEHTACLQLPLMCCRGCPQLKYPACPCLCTSSCEHTSPSQAPSLCPPQSCGAESLMQCS